MQADRALALAWWAVLLLRGILPVLFAIAIGLLVGAVQRGDNLVAPLVLVAAVFVPLQVLAPIHQAIGANLGSRTAAWLYDKLTLACVRPPGMGHLEDPKLTSDLTMARDFDLGISGPPMSISMDFIASGLVEMVTGLASAAVLARLRVVGAAVARRRLAGHALALARERRLARPQYRGSTRGTAPRRLRLPPCRRTTRGQGTAALRARGMDRGAVPRRSAAVCSSCAGRPLACASARSSGALCWCLPRTSRCSGRWRARQRTGRWHSIGWSHSQRPP